ncbi:S41 family peptidase [Paludibacter sp. 221]|uniref:S41 family peptidase n=1 Tax=Paludibacter sp. 221 TaxID=2302939 RepID=UPI0013D666FC|nr:S41 family peptidase [Paludibacter sp. 221]NDV46656.1 S41 family peptidase [Paludibacter sp. 221]
MKKNSYIALVIFLCIVCGVLLGNIMARRANMHNNITSFSNIVKKLGKGSKVDELLSLIDVQYVDTVNINKLTEDAVISIMADLDPHSVYIPASELEVVNSELEGSFGGIGVQFNIQSDTIMVVGVISGGPSEKAGLLAGDRIIEVDDSVFVGDIISDQKVMKKLRGPKNTKVKLGIKRYGTPETLYYTITRGDIPITSIDISYMIAPEVGFIRVNKFSATTYNEFLNGLAKLRNQGAKKLIIDLRGNSGGLMDQPITMVNEFLPRGEMIVYSEGKAYPRDDYRANGSGSFINYPLVVLIDEFSASASEIFAGAIQDNDRGLIIGRRSFGKGLVQQQIPFSDGSAVRLTIARYYTPTGRSIQKPYERGKSEEYEQDIVNRYMHGEFYTMDSIHLADSLIYHTPKGKVVYGGGGIMPDIFVARDTTEYSPYLNRIINYGYTYQFALQYADRNREKLNLYKSDWQDMESYLDKQNILNEFVAFAETKGVKAQWKEINKSKRIIDRQLKAYITRNIMGDDGFYPIFYKDDETIQKALEELNKM